MQERAQEPRNKIDPLVREKRLEFIRPFWEAMSKDERRALLSLPLEELRKRAELLDQGVLAAAWTLSRASSVCVDLGAILCETALGKLLESVVEDRPRPGCGSADIQGLDVLKLINDALARLEDSKPTWKSWRCLFLEQQGKAQETSE